MLWGWKVGCSFCRTFGWDSASSTCRRTQASIALDQEIYKFDVSTLVWRESLSPDFSAHFVCRIQCGGTSRLQTNLLWLQTTICWLEATGHFNIEYIETFGKSFKWIEVSTSSASRFLKFHAFLWQEDSQEFLSMFLAGLSLVLSLLQKTRAVTREDTWIRHDTWQLMMTFVNRHSKRRISAVPGEDVNRTTKKPYRELKDSEGRPDEEVPVRWCAMYQRRVWT